MCTYLHNVYYDMHEYSQVGYSRIGVKESGVVGLLRRSSQHGYFTPLCPQCFTVATRIAQNVNGLRDIYNQVKVSRVKFALEGYFSPLRAA